MRCPGVLVDQYRCHVTMTFNQEPMSHAITLSFILCVLCCCIQKTNKSYQSCHHHRLIVLFGYELLKIMAIKSNRQVLPFLLHYIVQVCQLNNILQVLIFDYVSILHEECTKALFSYHCKNSEGLNH